PIELAPDESRTMSVTAHVPASAPGTDILTGQVTVGSQNHPDVSTWSTIEARIGQTELSLDGPLVYRPYAHEN
ncbi:TPA: hypothetical protein DCE37_05390, partial [Candidatus Latescibacteria bacterium]|nr:hypothetical protein [Candidatus Latescibacterota bacterium]